MGRIIQEYPAHSPGFPVYQVMPVLVSSCAVLALFSPRSVYQCDRDPEAPGFALWLLDRSRGYCIGFGCSPKLPVRHPAGFIFGHSPVPDDPEERGQELSSVA